MSALEWPAQDYAIGSFIQASIAENFLDYLDIKSTDLVLDIGCGNGAFSRRILDKFPQKGFLGIDASRNMLEIASQEFLNYPQAKTNQEDVLSMSFTNQFDYVLSFWCLQWCAFDIEKAFHNIYKALKPKGKLLALFPSGDESSIRSYYQVKASGQFASLKEFKEPVDYQHLQELEKKLKNIPFKHLSIEKVPSKVQLPSLDTFRKFLNGLAFFHEQIPAHEINAINEAMLERFAQECREKYDDEYWFTASVYFIQGEK